MLQGPGLTQEALRAVLLATQEPVLVHDAQAVLACNAAFARLVGAAIPDELRGATMAQTVAEGSLAGVLERVRTGASGFYEAEILHRDGRRLAITALAQPVAVEGQPARLVSIRPRTPEAASRAELERLQEADQLKSRILNVAAHELNTPLTPMRLQAHLLLSGSLGPLAPRQRHAIEVVDRNVTRMSKLVGEILDVARLQSGHLRIELAPVPVEALVAETLESYGEVARRVGLALVVDAEPGIVVLADRGRIIQVLFNLVGNAMKFTPSGGQVRLRVHARGRGPAGNAEFEVQDTGAGLSGDQIARLFQPFSQVHDPNQLKVQGTGLGLYISRGIVEAHGGAITATSAGPNQGATFRFTLPLAAADATVRREPHYMAAQPAADLARRLRELI